MSTAGHAVDTHLSADVNAGGGWTNNPFARQDTQYSGSSGYYEIGITPNLSIEDGLTEINIGGHARLQDYFKNYSQSNSYGADASIQTRPSERLSLNARLSYDSSIVGTSTGGFGDGFISPGDPAYVPPVVGEDLGLFGAQARREIYSANAGFGYTLSARDSISGSGFYTMSRYNALGDFGDYDSYGGTLSYQRQLREHLSVGLQGSFSNNDYKSGGQGTTRVYSVQGTLDTQLSASWTLNGALGASFTDRSIGGGTKASLSGNVTLCRQGDRDQECLTASRQVSPAAYLGTQNQTSVTFTGNYKLSERTSLYGSASYTDVDSGSVGGDLPVSNWIRRYLRGEVGSRHRITERLSFSPSVFYRKFLGSDVDTRSDYGGRISLSYHLGDMR